VGRAAAGAAAGAAWLLLGLLLGLLLARGTTAQLPSCCWGQGARWLLAPPCLPLPGLLMRASRHAGEGGEGGREEQQQQQLQQEGEEQLEPSL
jgi:hypothetical protein